MIKTMFIRQTQPSLPPEKIQSDLETLKDTLTKATEADSATYTEKDLTPYNFSLNAELPSIVNLVTAPYQLITNVVSYAKEFLKSKSTTLEQANYKFLSNSLNFAYSALAPLSYAAMVGVYVAYLSFVIPILNIVGAAVSCVEIAANARIYHKELEFLKEHNCFDLRAVDSLEGLKAHLTDKKSIKEALETALKILNNSPLLKDDDLRTTYITPLESLYANLDNLSVDKAVEELHKTTPSLEKHLIKEKLNLVASSYFTISKTQRNQILEKATAIYKKDQNLDQAIARGLEMTKETFAANKDSLSTRVQPSLTYKFMAKYDYIMNNLETDESANAYKQGKELLEHIHSNATDKRGISLRNLCLFGSALIFYAASVALSIHPVLAVLFFSLTFIGYIVNQCKIDGSLNNPEKGFNIRYCLPSWCPGSLEAPKGIAPVGIKRDLTSLIRA